MRIVNQMRIAGHAVLDIFYPNTCQICTVDLTANEKHVCLSCSYDLPYIVQNKNELQQLEKMFWGRVDIKHVYSLLKYQKGNQTQQLMYELKYGKKTKLGIYFGKVLADQIPDNVNFDFVLPVPLHPKKKRQRGYNQSALIADGIARQIDTRVEQTVLKRKTFNFSQTKFSKYDRWENVRQIFSVTNGQRLENKHVLLVDDVLTTGATLEACAVELLKIKNCSVSIATLAARL